MGHVGTDVRFSPSLLYWSRGLLEESTRRQNSKFHYHYNYLSASLAVANLLTLPFTMVLDPIIGIAETIFYCTSTNQARLMENLHNKCIRSLGRHMKVFLHAVCINVIAIPIFYGFSIVSAFFFNLGITIPRVGPYLGCLTVSYIMHAPLGLYAVKVGAAFASC